MNNNSTKNEGGTPQKPRPRFTSEEEYWRYIDSLDDQR